MSKRVCVVGAGRWGMNHVRALASLGALGGVVDPDRDARARVDAAYPEIATFDDIADALAAGFDGYTVATPAETHFDLARRILTTLAPALVEKPLTLSSADARILHALADENKVNLMVGHVLLFHPAIRRIQSMIDTGKIGKLQYLYSNRLNLGTVRTEENILWSFAPHDISIFQYFIGRTPLEVFSRGGAFVQPRIHDSTMTVLSYPDNIVGHIFVSWLHPFKEHRLVVIGSKGMLSFEGSADDKCIRYYEKGIDWVRGEPIKREGPTECIAYTDEMPLTEELRYFVDHLDGAPVEIAGADTAVAVLEILERAGESLHSGEAVKLNHNRSPNGPATPDDDQPFFVHPSSFVDEHVTIGKGTKIWHYSHIQSGATIGREVTIGQNVNVGPNVRVGNHVKIQNNVSVYEGVELEDYVFCGPSMVFTNILDPRCKHPQRGSEHYRKTLVKYGASIGANATILCGNTLGRHAMIAAGAVVTGDVPDHALMLGIPARQKGWACECGEVLPNFESKVKCPRCTLTYRLQNDRLSPAT
ncbi:MAG: Gfo/Idh/MocA family oxidoreductase [Phycisphaerae bacterium]